MLFEVYPLSDLASSNCEEDGSSAYIACTPIALELFGCLHSVLLLDEDIASVKDRID